MDEIIKALSDSGYIITPTYYNGVIVRGQTKSMTILPRDGKYETVDGTLKCHNCGKTWRQS